MTNYHDSLEPLDIIIVYNPESWLHRLIKHVTKYKAGHVALYLSDGKIIEATSIGVKRHDLKNYHSEAIVYIVRVLGISEYQELDIRRHCLDYENRPYSFFQLIALLFKYFFKLKHVPDVSRQAMICSEFIAEVFWRSGINLCPGIDQHETTPGDILASDVVVVKRFRN